MVRKILRKNLKKAKRRRRKVSFISFCFDKLIEKKKKKSKKKKQVEEEDDEEEIEEIVEKVNPNKLLHYREQIDLLRTKLFHKPSSLDFI